VAILAPLISAQTCTTGINSSLRFDGIDDIVRVPDHPALDGFDDFTIEFWIEVGLNRNQGLLSKFRHSSPIVADDAYSLRMWPPGVLRVQLGSGTSNTTLVDGNALISDGSWHHVALTRNGTTVSTFVDGLLDLAFTFGGTLNATDTPLVFGSVLDGSDNPVIPFNGRMDEIRIWNVHRTESDIQQSMHLGLVGTEPGLVGYWRQDEGAGQLLGDSSSTGVVGSLGFSSSPAGDDPAWTASFPSPLAYCGAIGGGQANSPSAELVINGVGTGAAPGPFVVEVASAGALHLDWAGAPQAPLVLFTGAMNPGVLMDPGAGSLDLGTPPLYSDLLILFNGFAPPYNLFFTNGPQGTTSQTFQLPVLPSGSLINLQGIVTLPPGSPGLGYRLTAAFRIDVQ
jgi:hypothetical protein